MLAHEQIDFESLRLAYADAACRGDCCATPNIIRSVLEGGVVRFHCSNCGRLGFMSKDVEEFIKQAMEEL